MKNKDLSNLYIDISKESIDMFNIFRPNDLNLNIGISTKNGYEKAYFENRLLAIHGALVASPVLLGALRIRS